MSWHIDSVPTPTMTWSTMAPSMAWGSANWTWDCASSPNSALRPLDPAASVLAATRTTRVVMSLDFNIRGHWSFPNDPPTAVALVRDPANQHSTEPLQAVYKPIDAVMTHAHFEWRLELPLGVGVSFIVQNHAKVASIRDLVWRVQERVD
jgi:hypothetical protein